MFNKILVAVDGSGSSIYALDYAANLAQQNNAELTLLSVVENIPTMYTAGAGAAISENMQEISMENYKKMHHEQIERLKEIYPQLEITALIRKGKPASVVVEAGAGSDLIVVGHRGLGGILNWVLGSVAKQIVDSCSVPVLVVKEKDYC